MNLALGLVYRVTSATYRPQTPTSYSLPNLGAAGPQRSGCGGRDRAQNNRGPPSERAVPDEQTLWDLFTFWEGAASDGGGITPSLAFRTRFTPSYPPGETSESSLTPLLSLGRYYFNFGLGGAAAIR